MKNALNEQSLLPVIGRILLATIFVLSAIRKIMEPGGTIGYIESAGLPFATAALVIAIAVELGGGLMLALGIKTRLAAIALAVFTIVAGLAFHNAIGDQNQLNHLLKNLAIAGGLLQVAAFGAGAYSIDQRLSGKTQPRHA